MPSDRKQQVSSLLKAIETGDPEAVKVVNERQYIQHNPLTREGNVGLAELFARLAKTGPKVEIVRVFEDGDYVFAHTHYNFNTVEVGFEMFRYEGEQIVEHWDNLQTEALAPNASGRTMLDGPTEVTDLDKTETNRALIREFIQAVLIEGKSDQLDDYIHPSDYKEHHPNGSDGIEALHRMLFASGDDRRYQTVHRILAEGNFVLSMTEGYLKGEHVSFVDLFRLEQAQIVEHWDTLDHVPPESEWVNQNGKF
ncbi:MAG: nuclear transport factor 2 family protein [Granulosicoccaceae bacterium]